MQCRTPCPPPSPRSSSQPSTNRPPPTLCGSLMYSLRSARTLPALSAQQGLARGKSDTAFFPFHLSKATHSEDGYLNRNITFSRKTRVYRGRMPSSS